MTSNKIKTSSRTDKLKDEVRDLTAEVQHLREAMYFLLGNGMHRFETAKRLEWERERERGRGA